MSLEVASFISDLDVANPTASDKKKQGDDHLRLIKTVLKACFPNASKAFYFPATLAKSANFSVLSTHLHTTFLCDTTTAFTLTLPTLLIGDAGWFCYVLKTTTDANPVFIAPPSGTINSFTKVRRSVANVLTKILWTGTAFVASRSNGNPIGTLLPYSGISLPQGHLWADGSGYVDADFVELHDTLSGAAQADVRGRVIAGQDDMGGTSANRLTGLLGGVNGDTLGAAGGEESHVLTSDESAAHVHGITDPGHHHSSSLLAATTGGGADIHAARTLDNAGAPTNTDDSVTGITVNSSGGGGAHNNVQPTIIQNYIVVAE